MLTRRFMKESSWVTSPLLQVSSWKKKHSFLNSHYFFVYPFTFKNESTYMLEGNN